MDRNGVLRALAAALAVLAALLTPAVLAHAARAPGPRVAVLSDTVLPAEGPGARDWTAPQCREDLCGAPVALLLHGRHYDRAAGTSQLVVRRDAGTRTLTWELRARGVHGHSVLVGAVHSTSASDLELRLGAQPTITIPPGRLTLLPVTPDARTVTLVERGRVSATEALTIQEYALRE